MTCIVAVARDGLVTLAADSIAIDMDSLHNGQMRDPKIVETGNFLIGSCNSIRLMQIVLHHFKPPRLLVKDDLLAYMTGKFVEELMATLAACNYTINYEEKSNHPGPDLLVVVKGRMFYIEDDFSVVEQLEDYAAIGIGKDYALGSFYSTIASNDAKDRCLRALRAAAHHNAGVRPPYNFIIRGPDVEENYSVEA